MMKKFIEHLKSERKEITVIVATVLITISFIYLIVIQEINHKELDENRQQLCYSHFQTFEYKIFKDKLFCKVDNKWLEIAEGE